MTLRWVSKLVKTSGQFVTDDESAPSMHKLISTIIGFICNELIITLITDERKFIFYLLLSVRRPQAFTVMTGIAASNVYRWKRQREVLETASVNKKKTKKKLSVGGKTKLTIAHELTLYNKIMELRRAMIPVNGTMIKMFAHHISGFRGSREVWVPYDLGSFERSGNEQEHYLLSFRHSKD